MAKLIDLAAGLALAAAVPAMAATTPAQAPPTVAPDSEKLALAAIVAGALWPDGTYGRMVESMAGGNGLMDLFLDIRPSDIMGAVTEGMAGTDKAKTATPPAKDAKPGRTLREELAAEDPYFDERMRITVKVMGDEIARIARPVEPKLREGLAKSIARRFTREQLVPIAAFFQTDAGKAYAAQSMSLYIDKDVMLAIIQAVPAMVKEMPGALEKVKKATAHLPPPPKKARSDGEVDGDEQEERVDELPST